MKKAIVPLICCLSIFGCSERPDNAAEIIQEQTLDEPVETAPLWLEEVEGEKALEKVQQWNQDTLSKLTKDPRYDEFLEEALSVVNATDKIPMGNYRGGYVYNFWQDENSKRGLLRRTTLDSYQSESTEWEVLLDIDALNEKESANWVYKGSTCLAPDYTRCMISLSDGGKDAVEIREWDHNDKSFVENGFVIPEAKSNVDWVDENTLIVGTDWGEGTLTESGYPRIAKLVKRTDDLADAQELFAGETSDVGAGASTLTIGDGTKVILGSRYVTFYDMQWYWLKGNQQIQIPIPLKSTPQGVFKGQLLVNLNEQWTLDDGQVFPSGSLVSFDFMRWMDDQTVTNAMIVFEPDERSTVKSVRQTQSKVIVSALENVIGKIYAMDFVDDRWQRDVIQMKGKGTISIVSANEYTNTMFVNQSTFLTPSTLYAVNTSNNQVTPSKSAPARFEADGLTVSQLFATSSDGVEVPYFVVHKSDIKFDGNTPTLLYAYGGFQVSMTPRYSSITGKLWLENGGAYVLANIRGGGEFGPKWHQAGLKTNRQLIYNDMIAVGEDLIERKITSPKKLGIMGGSNGGLLMGVMYNQRPDLWNAVVCQVPLLDMMRYHLLLAGASWVGEYGNPEDERERAFLETISPLHNINEEGEYPTIFFVTSTKDDRVHPGHARKMAYVLEQYNHPFEYYENTDGGHSGAADLTEVAKRVSLEYVFLSQKLMD